MRPGPHAPFEEREHHDQHHEHPVLQHLHVAERGHERHCSPSGHTSGSERRISRKHRQPPAGRRGASAGPTGRRRGSAARAPPISSHEQAGPVVVVLATRRCPPRLRVRDLARAGDEGGRRRASRLGRRRVGVELRLQAPAVPMSASWSGDWKRRPLRRVARDHLRARSPGLASGPPPGGTEVSEAAAKKMENPTPISTSAKRRMRSRVGVQGSRRIRSVTRQVAEAEQQEGAEHGDLGGDHHAVGSAVHRAPNEPT